MKKYPTYYELAKMACKNITEDTSEYLFDEPEINKEGMKVLTNEWVNWHGLTQGGPINASVKLENLGGAHDLNSENNELCSERQNKLSSDIKACFQSLVRIDSTNIGKLRLKRVDFLGRAKTPFIWLDTDHACLL